MLCGRRAGKSYTIASWLLEGAMEESDTLSLFISLTSGSAKRIVWQIFRDLCRKHEIKARFNELELRVDLPNGSKIWLSGAPDRPSIERFRGLKLKRAAIDEAGSFPPYLRDLIEDVLEPALVDLQGHLLLAGTPGPIPSGLFYDITFHGAPGWQRFHWTILDNPTIPHARAWLEDRREKRGWDTSNPTYRREWLGEWVHDDTALVLPYDPSRNGCHGLPPGGFEWQYGLGVDLGYSDDSAFVVTAWNENLKEVFVARSYKKPKMIPSKIAEEVKKLDHIFGFQGRIVMDAGGLGKGYVEEMVQKWCLPIRAAEKREKSNYARLLAGELRDGRIKIVVSENRDLIDEMSVLRWDDDREKIADGQVDHLCDAFLYAWRDTKHYESRPAKAKYDPGTDDYWNEQADQMLEEEVQRMMDQGNRPWWAEGKDIDRPWWSNGEVPEVDVEMPPHFKPHG